MVSGLKDAETSEDEHSNLQEDISPQEIVEISALAAFSAKGNSLIKNGQIALVL